MKHWLSYLGPIRLKTVDSSLHNDLHIALDSGKKVLHSENVNYSYGPLQQILEEGLRRILTNSSPKSILLLGMAAGSVIQSLREKFCVSAPITAVEIDPLMVEIAQTEFQIGRFPNVFIHINSAENYVGQSIQPFDLIIVDVFYHQTIPTTCLETSFFDSLLKRCNPGGTILFNTFRETLSAQHRKSMIDFFQNNHTKLTILENVGSTNDLFLIQL